MGTASSTYESSVLKSAVNNITFTINGLIHTVNGDIPPNTSLNTYLREYANLRGTKFMCREGGCGCCLVAARSRNVFTQKEETFAVNSCLMLVYGCQGWSIKTIEGIGNKKMGYHTIQARLAHLNGSQCGYCSPGMVMNMFSLIADKDVTMEEVENSFGDNICRCTGYRPILDAFKSLCTDAPADITNRVLDIEETYQVKSCTKSGQSCSENCRDVGSCDSEDDFIHISVNGKEIVQPPKICPAYLNSGKTAWFKATKLSHIFEIFNKVTDVPYILVAGNTERGVYQTAVEPQVYIDVKDVIELRSYSTGPDLTLGGNMTLTEVMELFNSLSKNINYIYAKDFAQHIDLVANVPVRNTGTIAGNLFIKHKHNEFPSDIFVILETVGATLNIASKEKLHTNVNLLQYMDMDMKHRVIQSVTLPPKDESYSIKTYKIFAKAQNVQAYVNSGFLFKIDRSENGKVLEKPSIVYGGINPQFVHASNTENFLNGKNLFDSQVLKTAFLILSEELKPDYVLPDASPEFRKKLAVALFYKFVLNLLPPGTSTRLLSGGKDLFRPLSSGKQFFDTDKSKWPLTKPLPKLEALAQCSGEAQYLNDLPKIPGETYAAFVLTTQGQGFIESIDPTEALNVPGVLKFLNYKDIPGRNNFTPFQLVSFEEVEEVLCSPRKLWSPTRHWRVFCSGNIKYAGQPFGLIVAETEMLATMAVSKVKVTYSNVKKPLLNIRDVIASGDKTRIRVEKEVDSIKTNVTTQYEAQHVIKGTVDLGNQYHVTMETQQCVCIPTEDGLDVYPSTQWMDMIQAGIAEVLNVPVNSINIKVRRVGGAYGSKITRNGMASTACALAAHILRKPVRLIMSLENNMEALGKRNDVAANYEVGTDDSGKIQYLKCDIYENSGSSWNEALVTMTVNFMKSCYDSSTWKVRGLAVRTDVPSHTWCRGPGSTEGIAIIEHIMEHIAKVVSKDPIQVRINNMSKDSDNITAQMMQDLITSAEYSARKQSIDELNETHRWLKRGIALTPMRYDFAYGGNFYALVSIYAADGTVAVTHGGIECGQGINTKVAQAVAFTLGIDLELVSIKPSNNLTAPNNIFTGGSMASELCVYAAVQCCKELLIRMKPAKKGLKNPTWQEWVQVAYQKNIDLLATHMYPYIDDVKNYYIYGVTITEVEVDLLTGRNQIIRVDIVEDAGKSMNPDIDIGQVEGAFVMGLGYWLLEKIIYEPNTGRLLTNRTWNYFAPGPKDIPVDFRVELKRNAPNPFGVLRSKATGEPPICMSCSVLFALRYALNSARKDAGKPDEWYSMNPPATVENVFLTSLTDIDMFIL